MRRACQWVGGLWLLLPLLLQLLQQVEGDWELAMLLPTVLLLLLLRQPGMRQIVQLHRPRSGLLLVLLVLVLLLLLQRGLLLALERLQQLCLLLLQQGVELLLVQPGRGGCPWLVQVELRERVRSAQRSQGRSERLELPAGERVARSRMGGWEDLAGRAGSAGHGMQVNASMHAHQAATASEAGSLTGRPAAAAAAGACTATHSRWCLGSLGTHPVGPLAFLSQDPGAPGGWTGDLGHLSPASR